MVKAMDKVSVDGALLVSPYSMYRYDASYALHVHSEFPDRFGLIRPFNPDAHDVKEQVVEWSRFDGTVGARIMLPDPKAYDAEHPGLNQILLAAKTADLPVNVLCWGNVNLIDGLATNHPDTHIVIDHLGLKQPFEPPPPERPFEDLPNVLKLSKHDNVAIKITGACTLSHEPYPYSDIWDPLKRIFDTFGIERCLWGTDWTRAVNLLSYSEGVDAFRNLSFLSDRERDNLMGNNVARIYGWRPTAQESSTGG